jgi:hypothetical protein
MAQNDQKAKMKLQKGPVAAKAIRQNDHLTKCLGTKKWHKKVSAFLFGMLSHLKREISLSVLL